MKLRKKSVEELLALSNKFELPWLKRDVESGKLLLVVDNHLLSTYRSCADTFILQHVLGYHQKPGFGVPNLRRWYLDFGLVFHKSMETYYKRFREPNFDPIDWSTEAIKYWKDLNIDKLYSEHPEYKTIGG